MRSSASKRRGQKVRKKKLSVLGEGTYGCVVKPAIKCKEKDINVRGKVSKLMTLDDAKKELGEYEFISKIPGYEEYTLPVPQICTPKLSQHGSVLKDAFDASNPVHCKQEMLNILHKFESKNINDGYEDNDEYSDYKRYLKLPDRMKFTSLLLENGGLDLGQILDPSKPAFFNHDTLKTFLTATLKLIRGLAFFRDNDIIHKDIKLQNIVYNISTNVIKFIDFGLASKLSTFIRERNNNNIVYDLSGSIAYYPPEYKCTVNKNIWENEKKCEVYREWAKPLTWVEVNKKSAKTFDSFCLALQLDYMFDLLAAKKYITKEIRDTFFETFRLYFSSDVQERSDDVDYFYELYEKFLKDHGLFDDSPKKHSPTNSDTDTDNSSASPLPNDSESEDSTSTRPPPPPIIIKRRSNKKSDSSDSSSDDSHQRKVSNNLPPPPPVFIKHRFKKKSDSSSGSSSDEPHPRRVSNRLPPPPPSIKQRSKKKSYSDSSSSSDESKPRKKTVPPPPPSKKKSIRRRSRKLNTRKSYLISDSSYSDYEKSGHYINGESFTPPSSFLKNANIGN